MLLSVDALFAVAHGPSKRVSKLVERQETVIKSICQEDDEDNDDSQDSDDGNPPA